MSYKKVLVVLILVFGVNAQSDSIINFWRAKTKQLNEEDSIIQIWRAERCAKIENKTTWDNWPNWTAKKYWGFLAITGGIISGIITIADANGSTDTGIKDTKTNQNISVKNQWTKGHTIYFMLSISAIATGFSCFCK